MSILLQRGSPMIQWSVTWDEKPPSQENLSSQPGCESPTGWLRHPWVPSVVGSSPTSPTKQKLLGQLGEQELTMRLRPDVGWAPSVPTEARKPLEPARAWKLDELARPPRFHRWRPRAAATIPPGTPVHPDASYFWLLHSVTRNDAGEMKQVRGVTFNK
jgi:hypothetical protein